MQSTDFIVGSDPTAFTSITGAQLAQLVNSATPQADRGFVITTSDDGGGNPEVPDAATTTRYQRYIWRRISATSVTTYVWNPAASSDATYLKWKSISTAALGAGVITTTMIADLAVTDAKILSLDYSKITGFPASLPPSGAAGGDLTGTYPNPTINADAVTTAKIINSAVTTAKIADLNVTVGKLAGNGSAKDMVRTKVGSTTEMEFFTPPQIFTGLSNPNNTGTDDGKLVAVNSGAAGTFKYATGMAIQSAMYTSSTAVQQGTNMAGDTAAQLTTSQALAKIDGANTSVDITPTNVGSKIRVSVNLAVYAGSKSVWFGLYDVGATAFVAYGHVDSNAVNVTLNCGFKYQSAAVGALTTKTYRLYFGSSAGAAATVEVNKAGEGLTVLVEEIAA